MTAIMSFVTSIGARAWGYMIAAGAVVVGLLAAFGKARQSGIDYVAKKVNEDTAKATGRMLDAAVQAPKDKADVVKDLRSGKF